MEYYNNVIKVTNKVRSCLQNLVNEMVLYCEWKFLLH